MKSLEDYSPSNAPTGATAYGTLKNETAPEEGDGTPVMAEHIQDLQYALYAILQHAGENPNGTLESTTNKQVLGAMGKILGMKYNSATTYAKGMLAWTISSDVFKQYISKTNANVDNALSNATHWQLFYSVGIDGIVIFNDIFYDNTGTGLFATTVQDAITEVATVALPVGTILEYAGTVAPAGYLMVDGAEVSRTTYANLFSTIGITFGIGDGVNTFNLPNKKGRVGVGYDSTQTEFNTLGKLSGAKTHALTEAENGTHNHPFMRGVGGNNTNFIDTSHGFSGMDRNNAMYDNPSILGNSGSGTPHNNIQPSIAMNYIIKY